MTDRTSIIRTAIVVAGVALVAGSASGQEQKQVAKLPCPPVPTDTTHDRFGRVFIDGKRVGGNLRLRLESGEPESYEIVDPEPRELERLPASKIDLIQYDRGPEAEAKYSLCKGMVAIVIQTKKR